MTSTPLHFNNSERPPSLLPAPRILIADDDLFIRNMLEALLQSVGYQVLSAPDGAALVRLAQEHVPDLLLIDLMMPHLDGYEAIRQLRHDTRTAHLPMLVITARSRTDDVVQGFKAGADDFITKPFDLTELLARIQANLARAARQPVNNSLTGLPGNLLLVNNLIFRLGRNMPFAMLYADLDNFKIFNDTYGFARGDAAICMLAALLQEVLAVYSNSGDFVGHIGGDDFALLTSPDSAESICQVAIALFDERVRTLYEQRDLQRGYLSGLDRHGVLRRFPLMTLSIGVVSTKQRNFASHEEVSQAAAEMKHVAKSRPGSGYALDMRAVASGTLPNERRGAHLQEILLLSDDTSLLQVLHRVLQDEGYRVYEATTLLDANVLLARTGSRPLVIAGAQLTDALAELCAGRPPGLPLLVITDASDTRQPCSSGLVACIRQPFAMEELLTAVERLLDMASMATFQPTMEALQQREQPAS